MGSGDLGEGSETGRASRRPITSCERTAEASEPTGDQTRPGANREGGARAKNPFSFEYAKYAIRSRAENVLGGVSKKQQARHRCSARYRGK